MMDNVTGGGVSDGGAERVKPLRCRKFVPNPTDFNDLHQMYGAEEVRRQFEQGLRAPGKEQA